MYTPNKFWRIHKLYTDRTISQNNILYHVFFLSFFFLVFFFHEGFGCLGHGSDALLLRLWSGESVLLQKTACSFRVSPQRQSTDLPLKATLFFHSQCPFMDERILSLHQKIKTQPVVLPEQSVLVLL